MTPEHSSLKDLANKVTRKEQISVVFLGGSLTWGAGASNPQASSYRGLMMRWLLDTYPSTPMRFHDAAIGGTGSILGLFRLERDVLSQKPDLVFLDFTVNDDLYGSDILPLCTYERVLRTLRLNGIAVVPVIMSGLKEIQRSAAPPPMRYQAHMAIARAYGLSPADTIATAHAAVSQGRADIESLYSSNDPIHPDDPGYQLWFEAVRDAFLFAVKSGAPAPIPSSWIYPDAFPNYDRKVLVNAPLPKNWKKAKPARSGMWFDGTASRWMGDVACAAAGAAPLEVTFRGTFVALFGERNRFTPKFRVWIDGKPILQPHGSNEATELWNIDSTIHAASGHDDGNLFAWTLLAQGLSEGDHQLRIEILFTGAARSAELRIESICSAGR